jgi:hypothetical protein
MRQNSIAGECQAFIDCYTIREGCLLVVSLPGKSGVSNGRKEQREGNDNVLVSLGETAHNFFWPLQDIKGQVDIRIRRKTKIFTGMPVTNHRRDYQFFNPQTGQSEAKEEKTTQHITRQDNTT